MADPIREPLTDDFIAALRRLGMQRFLSALAGYMAGLVAIKAGTAADPDSPVEMERTFDTDGERYFDLANGLVEAFIKLASDEQASHRN